MTVGSPTAETGPAPHGRALFREAGFSLIEALTATVIAVIAVLGLAYTFSVGRGQVNHYEVARAALGEAESHMESLLLLADATPTSDSLEVGYRSPTSPFTYGAAPIGTLWWHIDPYNDPDLPANPDMRRLVVCVRWNTSMPDSVQFSQLLPLP
jgi:type II secretory pathway pseudopilin PulG